MERNIQKNGLVNLLVLLVVGLAALAMARYAHLLAGQVTIAFLGLAVLVAAVSWFQMRLEVQERLEKMEADELARAGGAATLFDGQSSETFPAQRAREQFEKFFVPGFTVLVFLLQAAGAGVLWRWLSQATVQPLNQPLVAMAVLALLALVLFIMGKYSAGLARLEAQRLLGPSASYLLLAAYLVFFTVLGIVAYEVGFPKVDFILARALCVLLALLAVETFVTLVLEIYRPRMKGKTERLLYESRLVGLLSRPEGIFTTAAHALDYQFGFKVSETWFYQFLQKALGWLVLAQVGALVLSSCFVVIEVGQQALLERFGKPVGSGVIGPGFHLKLPWPIDRVYRYHTEQIQTFTAGMPHEEEDDEHGHDHARPVILWTVAHAKHEFLLLVANRDSLVVNTNAGKTEKAPPVSLIGASIPVQYRISDLRAWAYNHKHPGELLEHIGTRELVRFLVNADWMEAMSRGRFAASQELRKNIQARADELNLGVQIVFVGMQDFHPPVAVAKAYEEMVSAQQKRAGAILSAEAHRTQTNSLALAEARRRSNEAEADRHRAEVGSLARVALFTNQVKAFMAAPEAYTQRAYLQTLNRGGAGARKYILATTNAQEVIQMNLEEKVREDLLNIALPTPAAPAPKTK